jgi:SAM-dependent methyltransferase
MDRPQPVSPELISDLRNLRILNRAFGGYRLIRHFLRRWIRPNDELNVLDLATGSGDIPRLIVKFARRLGASVRIDAVDFQQSTIAIARDLSGGFPEIRYHCAGIFEFGKPQSYDIVLVADLRRSRLAAIGVNLLTTIWLREPMTRNDARVSMQRAFSFRELHEMAQAAGWRNFGHRRFRFARQAIWLEHPPRE